MNIKEHIEAGHYPTDEKGHALVPTEKNGLAVVYDTSACPDSYSMTGFVPSIGRMQRWLDDGRTPLSSDGNDLLPPPPRKVKVTRWVVVDSFGAVINTFGHKFAPDAGYHLVELTGEYEEPWPDAAAQPAR